MLADKKHGKSGTKGLLTLQYYAVLFIEGSYLNILIRVERDDYRLPKTYAVRESFLFLNIFCIRREK